MRRWRLLMVEEEAIREAAIKRRIEIGQAISEGAKDPKAAAGKSTINSIGTLLHSYGIGGP
jgi:hypothetical protein